VSSLQQQREIPFECRPDEAQLKNPMGIGGLIEGTNMKVVQEGAKWSVSPEPVSVKAMAIAQVIVYVVSFVIGISLGETVLTVLSIIGMLIIAPFTVTILDFIDKQAGELPYIAIDQEKRMVRLPRWNKSFPFDQIQEVVLVCYQFDLCQLRLVIQRAESDWLVHHVMNVGCPSQRLHRAIADTLGVTCNVIRLSLDESQSLLKSR